MRSTFVAGLTPEGTASLIQTLHDTQKGLCFICDEPIDLIIQAAAIDIDHVVPVSIGGPDQPMNFALTHAACNRSKQSANLRVARVLARFSKIRARCVSSGSGPNLSNILTEFGGATASLSFAVKPDSVQYSLGETGDPEIHDVPLYTDKLSGLRFFFVVLPIQYLHHDDRINPREIGGSLRALVEEFFRGRPQLHIALAWINAEGGPSPVRVFDGQHKATAQVLLGVRRLPVRIFLNPDPDLLLTTNTNAGTVLRQVAFDKSVQRRLGSRLFRDRVERYRLDLSLDSDSLHFSEEDLIGHFKGESREMRRYVIDSVRDAVTHHEDNALRDYVDFGGRASGRPLSYSTMEKTFYSFFIYPNALSSPMDEVTESGTTPRETEITQLVKLMNIIADCIYIGKFDPEIGTYRIENRIQNKEDIPEPHLRSFRLSKEEILYTWLEVVRDIVHSSFLFAGHVPDRSKLFQYQFPDLLWSQVANYVRNLANMPVWVNKDLSSTVFGGKQVYGYWHRIFETGKAPDGTPVLAEPLNFKSMIGE